MQTENGISNESNLTLEEGCRESITQSCCKGPIDSPSCISADVDYVIGSDTKFFGCDTKTCMPKWDCVPSS